MEVQYQDIEELLRIRADLQTRLNLMPYDGMPEIKERDNRRYLYVRKRVAGKQTSTYVGSYSEELYAQAENTLDFSREMNRLPLLPNFS